MNEQEQEFENAVREGLEAKRIEKDARRVFDDGWLKFKEEIRIPFTLARDVLKRHQIEARVNDPNGDVRLEARWIEQSQSFAHQLICAKGNMVILLTSSLHRDTKESFGLDVAKAEVDSRIRKFLREVAEADASAYNFKGKEIF